MGNPGEVTVGVTSEEEPVAPIPDIDSQLLVQEVTPSQETPAFSQSQEQESSQSQSPTTITQEQLTKAREFFANMTAEEITSAFLSVRFQSISSTYSC